MIKGSTAALAAALVSAAASASPATIVPVPGVSVAAPLPMTIGGRVLRTAAGAERQWPGGYFETAFEGTGAYFRVGAGDVILHVLVDDDAPVPLVRPRPGFYRVGDLRPGAHRLRVEIASESQAGPTVFGGFFPGPGAHALPLPRLARQIEFIGDSHTVGYGNTSPTQQCTEDEVWARTDTSQSIGPLTAKHYGADYQVNAISGRGVVRNYNGFAADTLPVAYPYILFDKRNRDADPAWQPQIIVIALGTNDFTTPLHAGEKWATREALHADFEASYVRFVQALRSRNPRATFILWATDMADGEIEAEARKVVDRLHAGGEGRVSFLPMDGLAFSACNAHPSLADDRAISAALVRFIDAQPNLWQEHR